MSKDSRPNILLVFTDQQTARVMSCAGHRTVRTPNMDRLASEGVRFLRSYCASPVCGPARASMITGRMPHEHGLHFNHDPRYKDEAPERLPSLADSLRQAGYEPFWIGKWHAQEFYPTGEKDVHGFHYLPIPPCERIEVGLNADRPATGRAIAFLESPPAEPWFLGLSWHNPHDICYQIVGQYMDKIGPVTGTGPLPELPGNFEISPDEPDFIRLSRGRKRYGAELQATFDWTDSQWREYLRAYDRLTEAADAELGRILDSLDRLGLTENTLVVFTSDHGEGAAAHRTVVKLMPYEEAIAVPLIARLPGVIPAETVCDTHIASGVDLLPTFCDYAGATPPPGARGVSLRPMLENPAALGRDFAVVTVDPDPDRPEMTARVVVGKRWKYIAFSTGTTPEALYDLEADPGETRNLVDEGPCQNTLRACRERLHGWLLETKDPFRSIWISAEP